MDSVTTQVARECSYLNNENKISSHSMFFNKIQSIKKVVLKSKPNQENIFVPQQKNSTIPFFFAGK